MTGNSATAGMPRACAVRRLRDDAVAAQAAGAGHRRHRLADVAAIHDEQRQESGPLGVTCVSRTIARNAAVRRLRRGRTGRSSCPPCAPGAPFSEPFPAISPTL